MGGALVRVVQELVELALVRSEAADDLGHHEREGVQIGAEVLGDALQSLRRRVAHVVGGGQELGVVEVVKDGDGGDAVADEEGVSLLVDQEGARAQAAVVGHVLGGARFGGLLQHSGGADRELEAGLGAADVVEVDVGAQHVAQGPRFACRVQKAAGIAVGEGDDARHHGHL